MSYRLSIVALLLSFPLTCGCKGKDAGKTKDEGNMLYGRVTLDGEQIAGAKVFAQSSDGQKFEGFIDMEGNYRVPDPPQGAVTVYLQPMMMGPGGDDEPMRKIMEEAKRQGIAAPPLENPTGKVERPTSGPPENVFEGMKRAAAIPARYRKASTSPLKTVVSGDKHKFDLVLSTKDE